jgi:hypothetical protein
LSRSAEVSGRGSSAIPEQHKSLSSRHDIEESQNNYIRSLRAPGKDLNPLGSIEAYDAHRLAWAQLHSE